ncbi:hydroxyproline-rich glycoprotein family protein [Striga hermonthica]|uniref:Hydroxyproline-rich glycoprotein family protein n=1 Tax=Striga hermonthica TaxID=68872 RepID=A0A9N7MLJ0_STRHE|nr:hydroxyproline-rich glycoprotein family protein [Striga hermonthica]
MRGKSSSSKSKIVGLGPGMQREPHVSDACIRDLVKQLSSARTRDSSSFDSNGNIDGASAFSDQKPGNSSQVIQQQHKKARRRLHTSRPYQERMLNMAEARREIVTALKFHRAAMKQANDKQQQQQSGQGPENPPFGPTSHDLSLEEEKTSSIFGRNPLQLHSSNSSFHNNHHPPNYNYPENLSCSQGLCSPYSCPVPVLENLDFALPSQTLGLNLNLQDFNYLCTENPSSIYSLSSASTSSSSCSVAIEKIPSVVVADVAELGDSGLHHTMDDKLLAEMRSIGEQYQMEWNDTLSLVNSAWWFEFLKSMDVSSEDKKGEDFVNCVFNKAVEFPAWLNTTEPHVDETCSWNYFEDSNLPCMDIEEIDGMDGDWLA